MKRKFFVVFALLAVLLVGVFAGSRVNATPLQIDDADTMSRVPTIEYAKPIRRDTFESQEMSARTDEAVVESEENTVESQEGVAESEQNVEPQENTILTGGVPTETNENVSAQNRPVRYRVFGEGQVEVNPDCAEVTVRIEYTDIVKATAKRQAKSIYDELVSNLGEKGVENVKIVSDYVYPCCGREMCFKADMYATFKTCNLEGIQTLLTDIESEYITITGISYSVEDYDTPYAQAIKDAISNATAKVQKIVDGDVTLVGVREDYGCFPVCVYQSYDNLDITNDIQNPITITATIVVDFVAE